jgi:ankyrin repeat protein
MNETPLHRATCPEEIERLLDGGRDVDTPGWMGATPLHSAAERGLPEVARVLIRRGANVNARRPDRRDTPLHFAANAEVAGILIESGAEVESQDWSGRTPLHWAAQFGRADVADRLLRAGAGVDREAADGATPLHWAAQEGHPRVVGLLLSAGARLNLPDKEGRTPLHRAAWRGQLEAVEELCRAGADPTFRSRSGQTPLHEAREKGLKAVEERLRAARGATARAATARTGGEGPKTPSPLVLRKVHIDPRRHEAITVADQAILSRWSLGDRPRILTSVQAAHAWFSDLAVAPDGEHLAVATPEPMIEWRRWDDLELLEQFACPSEGPAGLEAIAIALDGRWIAVADSREQVHLIDRVSGRVVATAAAGERTSCVRFDPSSHLLATACSFQGGGSVRIHGIEQDCLIPVEELNRSDCTTAARDFVDSLIHLAFSPDGGSLALFETSAIGHEARPRGWRGNLVLYQVGSWKRRWFASVDARSTGDKRSLERAGHAMGFLTEVLFLDEETLACGATLGHVLFFRVADGKLMRREQVHAEAPVVSLARDSLGPALWAALGAGGGELVRIPL